MNKFIIIITGLFFILFTGIPSVAQQELNRYLETAGKNNPDLKARYDQYRAALEKVPQVGALPDPQLMFGYFIKPVETRLGAQRASISLSQAFPWFGTLSAQKDAATLMAKSDFEMFEDAKVKLYSEVKATYYNLYFIQKAIDIANENLGLLDTYKQLAQTSFEAGHSAFVDVLRVQMEWEDLNNKILFLQDSKKPLVTKFEELLNTSLTSEISIPDTLWSEDINLTETAIQDSIMANNLSLKTFDFKSESYNSQAEAARKMGLPSFNLGFNYINISPRTDMDVAGNGRDAFIFPQIGIRIPLYREKYKAMVSETRIRQEAVNFSKENTENKLKTSLAQVYRDYTDAFRRVVLYRKQKSYAEQSLSLLVTSYSTNGKNFEEVIRMDRRLLNYELELEKARVEQNTYAAKINYLMGQ